MPMELERGQAHLVTTHDLAVDQRPDLERVYRLDNQRVALIL
jgi:hypothetical protein